MLAVSDHLLRCNLLVCAAGDHVLLETKKEQVENTTSEPTQQELVVLASEEAEFSKTMDFGQFFKATAGWDGHGRSIALYCKEFT